MWQRQQGLWLPILRFNDELEGLTELRKAVIFMVMVYYSERIQIKFSKGKRHTGQGPGGTRHKLPVVCPLGVLWTARSFPSNDV